MTTMVTRLDRAPGIEDSGRVSGAGRKRPDPEVPARARRRTFTAQYKLEILAAYDAAAEGEKGALLRREGLYSSHIVEWRRARGAGAVAGLAWPRGRPRALSSQERAAIVDVRHSDRFVDAAPAQVRATLLDEGVYLGSISTFYRLLRQAGEARERRRQASHPATVKPELVATAPNQVWSWDITKLHGPAKWTYYHLYVILDIFSRYVVGWMVAHRESAALAQVLIRQTCTKQG